MKKCRIVIIAGFYSFLFANMLFAAADAWTQKADFKGMTPQFGAAGFSIGSKGYIGTGYNSPKAFWEYDPVADTWTQKADFGGTGRYGAVGFSIGSKGYIGTGSYNEVFARDFWEYDPATNTWRQKIDFGGTARRSAVGFSIGSKGYMGTGYDGSNKKDFWEYDPATNTWTQKADFGGTAREAAIGFSIGRKGYIGTGYDGTGGDSSYKKDFWEYDPHANTWTQKADFAVIGRTAVGFSIGSKGYIGTGYVYEHAIGTYKKDFWEYDPATNTWTQKADFGGTARSDTIGFSIGRKGYIGMGSVWDKQNSQFTYMKDFWEYNSSVTDSCTYTGLPASYGYSSLSGAGTVTITPSYGNCTWTAASNDSWITVTSGNSGTGLGTVSYTLAVNTTGSKRTGTMTAAGSTIAITQTGFNAALYFPHVDTSLPWQTEIAIINTSNQVVTGTLRALSNVGQLVETKDVTLSAHGRRQINVANEFTNHTDIGYIIFDTNSAAVQGYTKFYQAGIYRAAIPAVKEVDTSDIYISHIDSSALWWTGVSLVNTTATQKDLTITFNTSQSRQISLDANEHRAFDILGLFNNQPQQDIKSAVISNANGVIGLELFGSSGGGSQLDGLLLSDRAATTIYYPHVASDNSWWTGIVAYNPSASAATIAITPYSAQGTGLTPSTLSIAGKGKYVGLVSALGLPANTAWFKIDSPSPLSGFELFATWDGQQLGAYAGGGTGAKAGVFPKIEKTGWTGIAFVNTEANAASVTLTAYNDNGTVVATQVLPVGGHAKVVNYAETIFSQNISNATYIAYSSDTNVVGFQLNGSSDGMMLDGLPGL